MLMGHNHLDNFRIVTPEKLNLFLEVPRELTHEDIVIEQVSDDQPGSPIVIFIRRPDAAAGSADSAALGQIA